jgi:hypothetical protein
VGNLSDVIDTHIPQGAQALAGNPGEQGHRITIRFWRTVGLERAVKWLVTLVTGVYHGQVALQHGPQILDFGRRLRYIGNQNFRQVLITEQTLIVVATWINEAAVNISQFNACQRISGSGDATGLHGAVQQVIIFPFGGTLDLYKTVLPVIFMEDISPD